MTEQIRYRIPAQLKRDAEKILNGLGCDPAQAITMFYARVVAVRGLPFRPTEFPALEEYGVTLAEAEAAEEAVIADFAADRAAGKTFVFKGKL